MLDQRRRRLADVVQILYKYFVFGVLVIKQWYLTTIITIALFHQGKPIER